MRHLTLIDQADTTPLNGKSVQQRAAGRFYTHELIGRALADQVADRLPAGARSVSVIDPFAGDGRLICWLIEALAGRGVEQVRATLWDQDADLLAGAGAAVEATACIAGVSAEVEAWAGDTFDRAADCADRWTAVLTNPPWEVVKPDRREMRMLPEPLRSGYIVELKDFDQRLASTFPMSQPSRRFAGWGTNLSRVGTEVALRLTAPNGVCGVVCPTSLLADSTTGALRRWLLEHFALEAATHYPAEARLFDGVDMPCCTFVALRGGEQGRVLLTRVAADRNVLDRTSVTMSKDWLRRRDHAIPIEFGAAGIELLESLDHHRTFAELETKTQDGLWAGRELDETGRASFTAPNGVHPFVRSRHVHRLARLDTPSEFIDTGQCRLPPSTQRTRLVWRDISRPSQARRVHASLLEAGPVTGNSVSVAYFRDGSVQRTLALLAVVSSLTFEFQVRSLLMTHHVSLSVMRATRVPDFGNGVTASLARAAADCLAGKPRADARLEVATARAYGLDRPRWSAIASHFDLAATDAAALDGAWASCG